MERLKDLIRQRQNLIKKIKDLEKSKKDDPEQFDREIKKTRTELIAAENQREETHAQFLVGNCRQVDVLIKDNIITAIKQALIELEKRSDDCKAISRECSDHHKEARRLEKAIIKSIFEDRKKTFHNKVRGEVEQLFALSCLHASANAQAFAKDIMKGLWGNRSFSAPDEEHIKDIMRGLKKDLLNENSRQHTQ